MKTIKTILICISFLLMANGFSQNSNKNTFIRVFNLEGKKIGKGYVYSINDDILILTKGKKRLEIEANEVGKIKTKRSGGHNVLMGSTFGASLGIILGVSSADPDALFWGYTEGEGALALGTLGAIGGAGLGGIASLFKKSKMYIINGDKEKWLVFKEIFEKVKY